MKIMIEYGQMIMILIDLKKPPLGADWIRLISKQRGCIHNLLLENCLFVRICLSIAQVVQLIFQIMKILDIFQFWFLQII